MHFLKTIMTALVVLSIGACTNGPPQLNEKQPEKQPTHENNRKNAFEEALASEERGQLKMHLFSEEGGSIYRLEGEIPFGWDQDTDGEPDTLLSNEFTLIALPDSPATQTKLFPPLKDSGYWPLPEEGWYRCLKDGEPIDCVYAGSSPEPFLIRSGTTTVVELFFQIEGRYVRVCAGSGLFVVRIGEACNHQSDCSTSGDVCLLPENSDEGVCAALNN